jgi:hypothetical protein
VREVRTGVWHWEARHPEWNERQWWGPLVSSYAIGDGARLVLFDPLAPPAEIDKLAEERETAIVLTCPWHRREAEALASRYGATLYVPPPDEGDPSPVDGTVFRAGDRLPVGVEAFAGMEPNDLVLWSRATVRSSPATRFKTAVTACSSSATWRTTFPRG